MVVGRGLRGQRNAFPGLKKHFSEKYGFRAPNVKKRFFRVKNDFLKKIRLLGNHPGRVLWVKKTFSSEIRFSCGECFHINQYTSCPTTIRLFVKVGEIIQNIQLF